MHLTTKVSLAVYELTKSKELILKIVHKAYQCTWHLCCVCMAPRYCLTNLSEPPSQSFMVESYPREGKPRKLTVILTYPKKYINGSRSFIINKNI